MPHQLTWKFTSSDSLINWAIKLYPLPRYNSSSPESDLISTFLVINSRSIVIPDYRHMTKHFTRKDRSKSFYKKSGT